MEMDKEKKIVSPEDSLGDDNADILAAKRRQAAENAAKADGTAFGVPPKAKVPTGVSGGTASHPAGRTVSADGAQFGTPPRRVPTQAPGVQMPGKMPKPAEKKPIPKPAAAQKPTNAENESTPSPTGQKQPVQKPERSTLATKSDGRIPATIPHEQAPAGKGDPASANSATRVTDMHAVRTDVSADATRLSAVSADELRRQLLKKRQEEEEHEGGGAIMSVIKAVMYIVGVVVISVFLAVAIILVGNDVYAFVKEDTVVDVTVPENATLEQVSELLFENGVIEYPAAFRVYAQLKKDNGQYLSGTYSLTPLMNYDELLAAFKPKKPTGTSRITIPEGYTTDQIIDLLVSKGIGTREGYVDVINNYDFGYWFIDELEQSGWKDGRYYRLDGYLFPDTYEFYNASSEEVVIGKLLKRFNQVFKESHAVRARELGYTVDELLTLASMIEKEAGTQSDFFTISSVFTNRLKNSGVYPYLESDATVVYAIEHETGVHINPTKDDMKYESPYNTYTNKGLPPGPIANPSASAIRAALYPADTDYYYFYSASQTVTYYAKTLEEHNANIYRATNGG